jgi:transcriptional regulator with XRE-family HTH domain
MSSMSRVKSDRLGIHSALSEDGAGVTTLSDSRFSTQFAELLESKGLSKYRVAKDTGIDHALISRLASGDRTPTPEVLEKLALVFTPQEMQQLKQARAQDVLDAQGLPKPPASLGDPLPPGVADAPDELLKNLRIHFRAEQIPEEMQREFVRALIVQARYFDEHWDDIPW